MKYVMAPIWFATVLEKDNALRTRRETRCRRVLLKRSMWSVRRTAAGEAGCVPRAGGLAGLRVAQSDARTGPSAVLSGQLKDESLGGNAGSVRFVQQTLLAPVFDTIGSLIFGMSVGSFVRFGHRAHHWLSGLLMSKHDSRLSRRQDHLGDLCTKPHSRQNLTGRAVV